MICASDKCSKPRQVRDWCKTCYDTKLRRGDIGRKMTADEIMDEWDFLRGTVSFEFFGARIGMKQSSWERLYAEARAKKDPRARRARDDRDTWPDPAAGMTFLVEHRGNPPSYYTGAAAK